MDKLQQAIEFSDFQASLNVQRKFLREKFDADITIGKNGGIFKIDADLINFTKLLLDLGKQSSVLLDHNKNPIFIEDLKSFNSEMIDRYFSALGSYHAGYEEIKRARTKKNLAEL